MSASIWKRLGIARTRDRDAVRRAYASQLKTTHPEDDPEGFQALRAAYEQALAYAAGAAIREDVDEAPEPDAAPARPSAPAHVVAAKAAARSALEAGCARLDAILQAPRTDATALDEAARELLQSPALEAVDDHARLEAWFLRTILIRRPQSDGLIEPAIERFKWDRQRDVRADPALATVIARRDALAAWKASAARTSVSRPVRRALERPPGPFVWLRLFTYQPDAIRSRLDSFQGAPPPDMDRRAVVWWERYFSRPRPSHGALVVAALAGLGVAFLIAGAVLDAKGPGWLSLAIFLGGGPLAAGLAVALSFGLTAALGWARQRVNQRFWRSPGAIRLGWAPASLAVLLAAAVIPPTLYGAVVAGVLGVGFAVWALVVAEPDRRSLRFGWPIWGLMLQAYLVLAWGLFQTLPGGLFPLQLNIAFAGCVMASFLGSGSLADWWAGEVSERERLPSLVLLALAGAAAEGVMALAVRASAALPLAAAFLALVVFAHRAPAGSLPNGPLQLRHRVMWYGLVVVYGLRFVNAEWGAPLIAAWLLIGVGITVVAVGRTETGVWRAAWRAGRLAPRRSA